ncbi:hypothetical protein DFLDMN_001648 [Cupriavidus sp. H19C3]|uniref:hypothetical protein n=1 Tax=Cupriavidus sp. H19C3 TaxID=3241603 RepID=UPI003BF7E836
MSHDIQTILPKLHRFTIEALEATDWTHTTTARNNTLLVRFMKPYINQDGKKKHNSTDGFTIHLDDDYPSIIYNDPRTKFMFKKNDQELELKLWQLLTNTHTNNKGENHE